MRRIILAAAAAMLVLAGAAPAGAAPAWVPRGFMHVAATGDVDVNARGEAIAAYNSAEFGLGAVIHRPGGEWEPLVVPSLQGWTCRVRARIDDAGAVTMVWVQARADNCTDALVFSATLPPGAKAFGPANQLWGGGALTHLVIEAADNGTTVAAWVRSEGDPAQPVAIEAAVRPPGGEFGPVAEVSRLNGAAVDDLDVVVGPTGRAAAVWRTVDSDATFLGVAVREPGAADWSQGADYYGGGISTVAATFDESSGDLHVLWGEAPTDGDPTACGTSIIASNAVCAVRRTAAGVWQPRQVLATPPVTPEGIAADGGPARIVAAWRENDVLRSAVRPNGTVSAWTLRYLPATTPPSPLGLFGEVALDVGPGGHALVIWKWYAGYGEAEMAPDGTWSTPVSVASVPPNDGETTVSLDGTGNAVVAIHPGQFEFNAWVRDASGPDIALTVPGTATAGQPVAVGVQALDRWMPLAGAATIDYGDGTPPTTSLTHVYAAPGTYTVRATQADSIGNVGAATATITVTPAAPPPAVPPASAPPSRGAPPAATSTPSASIGLTSARFAVQWRASAAHGHLVLRGTSTRTAIVTGALVRPGFRKPLRFGVDKGPWVARIPVPRTIRPGRYQLVIDGEPAAAVAAVIGSGLRLAAPPEGVVADHRVSSTRNGPDALSFTRPRALHVTLRFAVLPRYGRPLRLDIQGPRGFRDRRDLRRRATVGAVVTSDGARLARGQWRFTLRAGGTVVKRVAVLVR